MKDELLTRDFYYRFDKGPVQLTRVWDAQRFADAQLEAGIRDDPPRVFNVSTEADYRKQFEKRR